VTGTRVVYTIIYSLNTSWKTSFKI
jgi:hypothetical protein